MRKSLLQLRYRALHVGAGAGFKSVEPLHVSAPRAARSVAAAPDAASRKSRVALQTPKPRCRSNVPTAADSPRSGSPADPHADRRARTAVRTSSSKPARIIAWKRCSMPSYRRSRSPGTQAYADELQIRIRAARAARAARVSVLPVSRCTSSARWMRCASFGWMRAAAAADRAPRARACSAGQPAQRRFGVDRRAHCGVGRRHLRESAAQRTEIEHRAADQQRQLAARADVVDRPPRVAHELARRIRLRRIENVDQVMRMPLQHVGRRLAGADVHAAIDHRRIDADDLELAAARPGAAPDRSCRRRSGP